MTERLRQQLAQQTKESIKKANHAFRVELALKMVLSRLGIPSELAKLHINSAKNADLAGIIELIGTIPSADIEITHEMIEAGELESSRAHKAGIIEGMNGLGGCMTKAEAPPEISRWFDRKCSIAEVIFRGMDMLCKTPFFHAPTPVMIDSGNHVMEMLTSAAMAKPYVVNNKASLEEFDESFRHLILAEEPTVAVVYRAMREAT